MKLNILLDFDILTAVTVKAVVLWDVVPPSLMIAYHMKRLGKFDCILLQEPID